MEVSVNLFKGLCSGSSNISSPQSIKIFSFGSQPVHQFAGRTCICLQQQIIMAKNKHFLLLFSTCPSICLKDAYPSAATDHHGKVQTFSPSVLHLSINLFEGLASVCSNRSSSQSRKTFSFCSWPVHQLA